MRYIRAFEEHILGTEKKIYIPLINIFVCHLKSVHHSVLRRTVEFGISRVYVPTKSLKHSYDRRTSFTENNIEFIFRTLKDPDMICKNVMDKDGKMICKRAHFIFFKQLAGKKYYAVPVEVTEDYLSIVSFFPSKIQYVQKFPILWDKDNPRGLPTLWDREDGGVPPS